jgi:diketogulonate reductase-like aldo/keto reductase
VITTVAPTAIGQRFFAPQSTAAVFAVHADPAGHTSALVQWRGLVELKRQGKARAIGVSNFSVKHIDDVHLRRGRSCHLGD